MNTPTSGKVTGEWFYCQDTDVLTAIEKHSWAPEKHTGTKYGCGVYLSKRLWYPDVEEILVCEVDLSDAEVRDSFDPVRGFESKGAGNTEGHLARYLQHSNVIASNHPPTSRGDSGDNIAIRDHFLDLGIKAVRINEHDHDVLIVYDTAAIRIVERRQLSSSQGESTT